MTSSHWNSFSSFLAVSFGEGSYFPLARTADLPGSAPPLSFPYPGLLLPQTSSQVESTWSMLKVKEVGSFWAAVIVLAQVEQLTKGATSCDTWPTPKGPGFSCMWELPFLIMEIVFENFLVSPGDGLSPYICRGEKQWALPILFTESPPLFNYLLTLPQWKYKTHFLWSTASQNPGTSCGVSRHRGTIFFSVLFLCA